MSAPQFTPGPWEALPAEPDRLYIRVRGTRLGGRFKVANALFAADQDAEREEAVANARLIAAAPDHADIGWAMCVAAGRWAPWGDGRGEFVLNGISFATKLDPFGVPEVTHPLRVAIAKARGDA